jgi:hypothetical protein
VNYFKRSEIMSIHLKHVFIYFQQKKSKLSSGLFVRIIGLEPTRLPTHFVPFINSLEILVKPPLNPIKSVHSKGIL